MATASPLNRSSICRLSRSSTSSDRAELPCRSRSPKRRCTSSRSDCA
jgi:hypothetical protein